ncbi:MAG: phosphate acyltransferase PlsX [Calditrichaceae bacterium]
MAYRIAVDAMGGDHAPEEIVKGVIDAMESDKSIEAILVGDEDAIKKELDKYQAKRGIEIVHTDQWVGMDESPKKALESKPRASINLAARLVNDNLADALLSAGNTGATVLAAAQNLPIIPGIERTALAAIYPTAKFVKGSHGFALMLDVGATIKCTPKQLVHFAFMGNYYVSHILGIPQPRVALLNIGEEATKGGEVLTKTYEYLQAAEGIHFIGNVEGKDIPKGAADVIVTEGFVGNVVLKLLEGVADVVKETGKYAFKKKLTWKLGMVMLSEGVKRLKIKTDYSEYGGAPVLGFKKLVIKSHGRSNAKAISNAMQVAVRSVKEDVCSHIGESIAEFNARHRLDFIEI